MFDDEFISVVMAGDGQMNPGDMPRLLSPIINKKAHYVKGERKDRAGKMPNLRRFGTMLLAFLTTLACGQTIRDPQCGYTLLRVAKCLNPGIGTYLGRDMVTQIGG